MKFFLHLLIVLTLFSTNYAFSQLEETNADTFAEEPVGFIKAINGDIGYFGPAGLSLAAGFRYWFAGFTLGISGISKSIPNYALYDPSVPINPNLPLPNGFDEKSYPALIVTGDFTYYHQIVKQLTAFGSLGFYSQQDTVLAWDYTNNYYYYYKHISKAGICFGIGGEYLYSENLNIGLGYHTKRGLFARITYFWF